MREENRLDRTQRDKCVRPSPNQHGFEEYISGKQISLFFLSSLYFFSFPYSFSLFLLLISFRCFFSLFLFIITFFCILRFCENLIFSLFVLNNNLFKCKHCNYCCKICFQFVLIVFLCIHVLLNVCQNSFIQSVNNDIEINIIKTNKNLELDGSEMTSKLVS